LSINSFIRILRLVTVWASLRQEFGIEDATMTDHRHCW